MVLLLGIKTTKWNWIGFGLVLIGLVVFSLPLGAALLGVLCAAGSGIVEAIQRKAWNKLGIDPGDRFMVGLSEFASWFVVATLIFFVTSSSMNLGSFSITTF